MPTSSLSQKQREASADTLSALAQEILVLVQRLSKFSKAREIESSVRKDKATQISLGKIQLLLKRHPELFEVKEKVALGSKNEKALANAKARGDLIKEHLISSKELVLAAELASVMGISTQALNKGKGSIYFALNVAGKDYYPAFFADIEVREGLKLVLKALKDEGSWSKWIFLTSPSGFLGQEKPIDAIRKGRMDAVEKAARGYVER